MSNQNLYKSFAAGQQLNILHDTNTFLLKHIFRRNLHMVCYMKKGNLLIIISHPEKYLTKSCCFQLPKHLFFLQILLFSLTNYELDCLYVCNPGRI